MSRRPPRSHLSQLNAVSSWCPRGMERLKIILSVDFGGLRELLTFASIGHHWVVFEIVAVIPPLDSSQDIDIGGEVELSVVSEGESG